MGSESGTCRRNADSQISLSSHHIFSEFCTLCLKVISKSSQNFLTFALIGYLASKAWGHVRWNVCTDWLLDAKTMYGMYDNYVVSACEKYTVMSIYPPASCPYSVTNVSTKAANQSEGGLCVQLCNQLSRADDRTIRYFLHLWDWGVPVFAHKKISEFKGLKPQ